MISGVLPNLRLVGLSKFVRQIKYKQPKMKLKRIDSQTYNQNPDQYRLVSGKTKGAPKCPYGNTYRWIGYDNVNHSFVRFSKSIFKKLIEKQ